MITARALELLAASQSLPNHTLKCATCSFAGPVLKPAMDARNGNRWGAAPDHALSYAFDWSAPSDPAAYLIILADRDPEKHHGKVMVVFGDSHTKSLTAVTGQASGLLTENSDGKPMTTIVPYGDTARRTSIRQPVMARRTLSLPAAERLQVPG